MFSSARWKDIIWILSIFQPIKARIYDMSPAEKFKFRLRRGLTTGWKTQILIYFQKALSLNRLKLSLLETNPLCCYSALVNIG